MYQLKLFWKHTANTYNSTPTSTTKATFCMRYYKYYFLFWLLLKCLLYKNCMILNHFDFWYDGMIFKESTIFLWREKKDKKFYGLWSEVWPELSKEPLFCGFCQKALFEERYIYSAITIIISKQTAIYKELYFISYISNKLGMFLLVWTVSTRFCGLCFGQAMMVNNFL